MDCLGRCAYDPTKKIGDGWDRCIVTLAGAGFGYWLRTLLESLSIAGEVDDIPVVALILDGDEECLRIASDYGATVVPIRHVTPLSPGTKSVMYSIADFIDADRFVCLDADTVCYGNLREFFDTLNSRSDLAFGMVSDGNENRMLKDSLKTVYRATNGYANRFISSRGLLAKVNHNDGVMVGTRRAFQAIDAKFRTWNGANLWTYGRGGVGCLNQLLLNLAAHEVADVFTLPDRWNVQLHQNEIQWLGGIPFHAGQQATIVHWTGPSKEFRKHEHCLPVSK